MAFTLTIPELGVGRKGSTKDLIIKVLSEEWPLSAKEIFYRISKISTSPVSYQAVHKMIQFLLDEGMVAKNNSAYSLSSSWIDHIKRFVDSLDKKYKKDARKDFVQKFGVFQDSMKFHFDDVTDFSLGIADMLLSDRAANSTGPYRIACLRHGWWPLTFNFDQFLLLKKIIRLHPIRPYNILRRDFPFSKWLNNQYNLVGFRSKITPGLKDPNDDIAIIGNMILQVNYSNKTKKALDELYKRNDGLTSLFKEYVKQTFYNKKVNIDVKFTEDPSLATTLGRHYMEIWRSAK